MSIGPSLSARERTATPEPERHSTTQSFALRYAKRTFDPFNTRPCPEMFEDKWAADE